VEYSLLEKTEVWVTNLGLHGVNLTDLASAAAAALGLERAEVLVVDVRDELVTFDILRKSVRAEDVAGKKDVLLQALAAVPGVTITGQTAIHSDGVLGVIALEPEEASEVLERTRQMTAEIRQTIARRAIVYSSGFEVLNGLIADTNGPYIQATLEQAGFHVSIGPILEDAEDAVAFALRDAINRGFGLGITTGGVGAEDKDHTVEGLLQVDPEAATAWLVKYEKGQGRHVKNGVRIAVGQVGPTTLVTLPGPNDEVRAALPILLRRWSQGPVDKHLLAEEIAAELRQILAAKMQRRSGAHHH
jgi:molybdenum cofactor synthesis domain-containing protein